MEGDTVGLISTLARDWVSHNALEGNKTKCHKPLKEERDMEGCHDTYRIEINISAKSTVGINVVQLYPTVPIRSLRFIT